MENFNELFARAQQVSDCRKKIFGELIEKVQAELIPRFCEAMSGFDIHVCYFKMFKQPTEKNDMQSDQFYTFYAIAIREDGLFCDAIFDEFTEKYRVPDHWQWMSFKDHPIRRTAVLELVSLLNSRLADLVKKHEAKNDKAKGLLNA